MPQGRKNNDLLNNAKNQLMTAGSAIQGNRQQAGPKELSIYQHLLSCASVFYEMNEAPRDIDPLSHEVLEENWRLLGTEIEEYLSDRNVGQNRELFLASVKEIRRVKEQLEPVYSDLLASLKHSHRLKQDYAQGLEEERMNAQYRNTGAIGHAPSMEELTTLSGADTPMDLLFDRMLWLATMDHRGSLTVDNYHNMSGNFLRETFERLNKELTDSSMDRHMDFMERWNRHMLKTRDLANSFYREQLGPEPTTKERQNAAMTELAKSPLYESCQVMERWHDSFYLTWMDSIRVFDARTPEGMDSKEQRSSNIEIGGMLAGKMVQFLRANRLEAEVTQAQASRFAGETWASGMLAENDPISGFARQYSKLLKDERDASDSFTNMRDALRDFANLDHRNIADPADYRNKLTAAKTAVQEYLDAHPGTRGTTKGKERQAMAGAFREVLGTWRAPQVRAEAQPEPGAVYDRLNAMRVQVQQMAQVLHSTESAMSRDSVEFTAMRDAMNAMERGMSGLPAKEAFTAAMAADMTEKLEKLSVTAKAYADAKEHQPKNERRQLRYDLAKQVTDIAAGHVEAMRQSGNPQYSYAAAAADTRNAMAKRMMESVDGFNPDNLQVVSGSEAFRRTVAGMTLQEMRSAMGDRKQVSGLFRGMVQHSLNIQRENQRNGIQREPENPILQQNVPHR